jgi:hypothetical protein
MYQNRVFAERLEVANPVILLGTENTSGGDTRQLGASYRYYSGGVKYTGLVRDTADGKWKVYDSLTSLPGVNTGTGIVDGTGFALADFGGRAISASTSITAGTSITATTSMSSGTTMAVGTNLTVAGNATISGDLTVSGTTTTVNTNNLLVEDNIIVANAGPANMKEDAGFLVKRTSANILANDNTAKVTGTINAGTSSTVFSLATGGKPADYYKGWLVTVAGTESGTSFITTSDTDGSNTVVTLATALTGTPANTDTYNLYNRVYKGLIHDETANEIVMGAVPRDNDASGVFTTSDANGNLLDYVGLRALNLTTSGAVSAGSTVTAGTGLTVTTGNATVSSGNISVTSGTITSSGNISSSAGALSANTSVTAGTTVSAGTTVTAGTGLTVTTGNATVSSGNISVTSGTISASGNISSSSGALSASTTVTAGTGLTVSSGGANVAGGVVVSSGNLSVSAGTLSSSGNISSSAGSVSANTTVTAGTGLTVTTGNANITAGTVNVGTNYASLSTGGTLNDSGLYFTRTTTNASGDTAYDASVLPSTAYTGASTSLIIDTTTLTDGNNLTSGADGLVGWIIKDNLSSEIRTITASTAVSGNASTLTLSTGFTNSRTTSDPFSLYPSKNAAIVWDESLGSFVATKLPRAGGSLLIDASAGLPATYADLTVNNLTLGGTLSFSGTLTKHTLTITATTSLTAAQIKEHDMILFSPASANIVITLPEISTLALGANSVSEIVLVNTSDTYTVTINPGSGDTIELVSTVVLSEQYVKVTIGAYTANVTDWLIL